MTQRQSILIDIGNERVRQEQKWDTTTHDDTYIALTWAYHMERYIDRSIDAELGGDTVALRKRYIQIAALAVAAVEALDRKASN